MEDIILMRKKRGKPNRGGGRSSRGRGRGKSGREHQSGKDDKSRQNESRRKDYPKTGNSHVSKNKSHDECKEVKVQMQRLHMSTENQDMVRDMLKNLHGEDLQDASQSGSDIDEDYDGEEFDELDVRSDDQYWMTDNTLYVEDSIPNATKDQPELSLLDNISPYALNRLLRYGYERQSCIEALQINDGDVGSAYEYLFTQCFFNDQTNLEDGEITAREKILIESGVTLDDVKEQRNEEMTALQSIYEDNFTEKIQHRVWTLKFECKMLRDLVFKPDKSDKSEVTSFKSQEICKFHLKGACRFGSRCKYAHDIPNKNIQEVDDRHLKQEVDTHFELDLRFNKNNMYPWEPPIIGFSAIDPNFPPYISLNITEHMYKEAKTLSESQSPIVFSLVSLLEDEVLLRELVEKMPLESSLPPLSTAPWKQRELSDHEIPVVKEICASKDPVDSETNGEETEAMIRMVESDLQDEIDVKVEIKRSTSRDSDDTNTQNPAEVLKQNKKLKEDFVRKQNMSSYKTMKSQRKKLPVWDKQDEILSAVNGHQVTVISGMTGCGKTTQVPQFILDSFLKGKGLHICNILCTQPRRISAMSVAERVANERAEKLGKSVGYQIRLEKVQSGMTRLLFCTTGIVLRRLEGDPKLDGVTHIIIDEVHERSQESDFLIMYLRDVLYTRPDLKIILMSATLNSDLFSAYFNGCPVIDIPGKTFPVDQYFLEDVLDMTRFVMDEKSPYARPLQKSNATFKYSMVYDDEFECINNDPSKPAADHVKDENLSVKQLKIRYASYSKLVCKTLSLMDMSKINFDLVVSLLEFIVEGEHEFPQGSILVFVQGFTDIQTLLDLLNTSPVFSYRNQRKYKIVPLHSSLSSEEQQIVFTKPPEGVTKIVIATNIAETSITIDDIVFVIDVGKMKEKRYDPCRGMESLDTAWVSKANALQRKGRAGRVTHGVCFHLFTSHRYHNHLLEQPVPEIQRAPLEQIVLRIKMLDIFHKQSAKEVLEQLLEPPEETSILAATKRLQDLGALDEKDELTPLGYHLGSLPVDVRIGKLMLFGAIFRCLDPALTIAASLSFKSPFVSPFGKKVEATQKKLEFATGNSDHLTMLNGYQGWLDAKKKGPREAYLFCQDNFLSQKSLQMLVSLKQQFVELLSDIGFVKEGITYRDVERAARYSSDGVIEMTGVEANSNVTNLKLISAILVGALYPNVVQVMTPHTKFNQSSTGAVTKFPKPEELKFKTKSDGFVHVHPSSVNFQVRYYECPYLVYHEMVKTSKVFIRDCTMVSVYPLLLFGGGGITMDLDRGNFILSVDDGWIRFLASSHQIAELVRELRTELDQLLSDKIKNPHMDLCSCPKGSRIIDTIVTLISTQ